MYNEARKRASMRWDKANYDKVQFTAPKGYNARLTEAAKAAGKSKRQYIIEALEEKTQKSKMKLYWVSFIIYGERPYFLSHSKPYLTLEKANDSIKKMLESYKVILSYIQEQDAETGELLPIAVTPHINSLGGKL